MTTPSFQITARARGGALVLLAVGLTAAIFGVITNPERTWPNLLIDGFYVTSLGVSSIFFLAAHRATGARWSASLRRIPEAFMPVLPVAFFLIMVLFFG